MPIWAQWCLAVVMIAYAIFLLWESRGMWKRFERTGIYGEVNKLAFSAAIVLLHLGAVFLTVLTCMRFQ